IEPPELVEREALDEAAAAGRAVHGGVVDHDRHAVARDQHVELDAVRAGVDRFAEGGGRVFGREPGETAVGEHLESILWPKGRPPAGFQNTPPPVFFGGMPGYDLPSRFWTRNEPLRLECGGSLPGFRVAYETWGRPNEGGGNAVVVIHALSGSSHAFAAENNPQPGWWEGLISE